MFDCEDLDVFSHEDSKVETKTYIHRVEKDKYGMYLPAIDGDNIKIWMKENMFHREEKMVSLPAIIITHQFRSSINRYDKKNHIYEGSLLIWGMYDHNIQEATILVDGEEVRLPSVIEIVPESEQITVDGKKYYPMLFSPYINIVYSSFSPIDMIRIGKEMRHLTVEVIDRYLHTILDQETLERIYHEHFNDFVTTDYSPCGQSEIYLKYRNKVFKDKSDKLFDDPFDDIVVKGYHYRIAKTNVKTIYADYLNFATKFESEQPAKDQFDKMFEEFQDQSKQI